MELRLPLPAPLAGHVLRAATVDDVPAVVALLSDDPISASRGDRARPEDMAAYRRGFGEIDADPANVLLVLEHPDDGAVATMQLTLIPGMARAGAARLQVEAVRVRSDRRSGGLGAAMMQWVIQVARDTGAGLIQLTSDAARADAHRFYERLGFAPSHVGFKYRL